MVYLLLLSVFVIATCGLVYELIAGALASYLLGDSITQFSTIIGAYLFAMGIGSYLSKYVRRNLTATFIQVELLIGLVGGCSAALLFVLFEQVQGFRIVLYALVGLTGMLVGLEIPLLMRILKAHFAFTDLVSNVFTFDYIGALLASLLFPLVLVPHLGLVRSAFLFGMFNVAIALWTLYLFRREVVWAGLMRVVGIFILLLLLAGMVFSDAIMGYAEAQTYNEEIVYAKSTAYQRIVLTKGEEDMRLYLNGNLQFSSRDEYRYHEALVHPGLAAQAGAKRVLILGGGDGLALREVLKYAGVQQVTLVDLDSGMTRLFERHPALLQLSDSALLRPRVRVVNDDAFLWLRQQASASYDFVVVDFPDPSNFSIGKLYSLSCYRELRRVLAPGGAAVVQSTSPYVARRSYWCVVHTLQAAGFVTQPYHAYVPSFGEWGFVWAGSQTYQLPKALPSGLRFVSQASLPTMLQFPDDMGAVPTEVNRLNNQALVRYFEQEWASYPQH